MFYSQHGKYLHINLEAMRMPGKWMQQPTDDRILEALDTGLALKPAVIGYNIDKSRRHVQRRLKPLVESGLVEKTDDAGYYEITPEGSAYLAGGLDASDIDVDG